MIFPVVVHAAYIHIIDRPDSVSRISLHHRNPSDSFRFPPWCRCHRFSISVRTCACVCVRVCVSMCLNVCGYVSTQLQRDDPLAWMQPLDVKPMLSCDFGFFASLGIRHGFEERMQKCFNVYQWRSYRFLIALSALPVLIATLLLSMLLRRPTGILHVPANKSSKPKSR